MTEPKTTTTALATAKKATQVATKANFSAFIKADNVQKSLEATLGDTAKTKKFTAALISAVTTNPALRECDATTIISSALIGEALNLSPSPQLGHYYIVPFKNNKLNKTEGTFQLGWKGYYQLALRTGQYRSLDAFAIKEGELKHHNPLTGEIDIEFIEDEDLRDKTPTIGYYAYFELINGFRKSMYWTRSKMQAHAEKYSKGYAAHKGYTFWEKDFDSMAIKTLYRQLISKYGIMSIEMEKAYTMDMSVPEKNEVTGEYEPVYFDNGDVIDA